MVVAAKPASAIVIKKFFIFFLVSVSADTFKPFTVQNGSGRRMLTGKPLSPVQTRSRFQGRLVV